MDSLNHAHVRARDMVVHMEHTHCGPISMVNTPVKYSECQPCIRSPPPVLGEHTNDILRELVGLTEGEIAELKAEGAVK
jgi:succinate--hydroxymethylglutarate CoA-transferase